MQTTITQKTRFTSNLEENIIFECFSNRGYRIYSENTLTKIYFHYDKNGNKLTIRDISTVEKVVCPECKKDDYIKIQRFDGLNTKYECKNKSCNTRFFRYKGVNPVEIKTKTLDKLIKLHFGIRSIKEHKQAYEKYYKRYINSKRIVIEEADIEYLEHYLLLGIPRDLIAELFLISTRTLQRFINREEDLERINKNRFKKNTPIEVDGKLIIHEIKYNKNPFKSAITYSYIDFTDEDYDLNQTIRYLIEKKINKKSQK